MTQLGTAGELLSYGEVPPIAVLISEIQTIRGLTEGDRLPFDKEGESAFRSLSADIAARMELLGPRLATQLTPIFSGAIDPQWDAERGRHMLAWGQLFDAAVEAASYLSRKSGIRDALLDALDAASRDDDLARALEALRPVIDDLRGILEGSGWSWSAARDAIRLRLTVAEFDDEGQRNNLGWHPVGTSSDQVVDELVAKLHEGPPRRDWAVWLATRAGPGDAQRQWLTTVSGPVAVSGLISTTDAGAWVDRVRRDLVDSYEVAGFPVPPDVNALGQGARFQDEELETGLELWNFAASRPCFLTRIEVTAAGRDEAIEMALETARAVFSAENPHLASDILGDCVLWTPQGRWTTSGRSARGLGQGEFDASRMAVLASSRFAQDLGSPIDAQRLERLKSRALARNPLVSHEVRVMRAWSELESLAPLGSDFDSVAVRLHLQTAWHDLARLTDHVVARLRDRSHTHVPRVGVDANSLREAVNALKDLETWPNDAVGYIAQASSVVELLHEDTITAALARLLARYIDSETAFSNHRENHALAVKRARRHRNLTIHGFRLPEPVLRPTVAFLSRQLEIAVRAHEVSGSRNSWSLMGSLMEKHRLKPSPKTFRHLDHVIARTAPAS